MKKLLTLTALALLFTSLSAQQPDPRSLWPGRIDATAQPGDSSPRQHDAPDLWTPRSRVQFVEHGDAAQTVAALRAQSATQTSVPGYRVRIFFDNGQNARSQAAGAQEQFRALFPATPSYLSYENPYFKVTVGNCTSLEEAIILLASLEGAFPKAFIANEQIPLIYLGE